MKYWRIVSKDLTRIDNQYNVLNSLRIAERGIEKLKRLETYESLLRVNDSITGPNLSLIQIEENEEEFDVFRINLEEDYKHWVQGILDS